MIPICTCRGKGGAGNKEGQRVGGKGESGKMEGGGVGGGEREVTQEDMREGEGGEGEDMRREDGE